VDELLGVLAAGELLSTAPVANGTAGSLEVRGRETEERGVWLSFLLLLTSPSTSVGDDHHPIDDGDPENPAFVDLVAMNRHRDIDLKEGNGLICLPDNHGELSSPPERLASPSSSSSSSSLSATLLLLGGDPWLHMMPSAEMDIGLVAHAFHRARG
jgi:hypothetical protein